MTQTHWSVARYFSQDTQGGSAGLLCAFAVVLCASLATAATAAPGQVQNLDLAALQQAAIDADPRLRNLQLQPALSELKSESVRSERLPSVTFDGRGQYQTDVPSFPGFVPGGQPVPLVLKATVDASVRLNQPLFDATINPRLAAEDAQLAEAQARVRTTLFSLKQEVNEAFFAAALLQERADMVAATVANLEGRLRETEVRVREGAALESDAAAVEATLLERRQESDEVATSRRSALARLSRLTGRTIDERERLLLPAALADVAKARARSAADLRTRPEYDQFDRTKARLVAEQTMIVARDRPRLAAFGQVGVGRPGLDFLNDTFDVYAVVGLQLQWKPINWGSSGRDREALGLEQQIVTADEAAFTRTLVRSLDADVASIDRLERALELDNRIVELRETVERTTGVRFREGVVTAAEYLDRTTELLHARVGRAAHQVELAQTSARVLTSLGLEVR